MYNFTHSLTSALDGGEWIASRPGRFTPRKKAPCTHWIGGWVVYELFSDFKKVCDSVSKGVLYNIINNWYNYETS